MLRITEYPHQGPAKSWEAANEEDFCLRVLRANPRADIDPRSNYATVVAWLRADLRALSIQRCY